MTRRSASKSVCENKKAMDTDAQTPKDDHDMDRAGEAAEREGNGPGCTRILSSSSRSHVGKGKGLGMAGICV